MKLPSARQGFRISIVDIVVLCLATAGTIYLWPINYLVAALIPIIVGHFFLFCNVFRVRSKYEFIWAGIFLVNTTGMVVYLGDKFSWLFVLIIQIPLTIFFIVLEMKSSRYHGVAWAKINPGWQASDSTDLSQTDSSGTKEI